MLKTKKVKNAYEKTVQGKKGASYGYHGIVKE